MNVNESRKNFPLSKLVIKDLRKTTPTDRSKSNWRKGLKFSSFEGFNRVNGVKKYLCIGGEIGGGGFVSCSKIPELYGVSSKECVFLPDAHADKIETMPDGRLTGSPKLLGVDSRQFIVLRPDSTGRYTLPVPIEVK